METNSASYRVAAVQMEPKLGRMDANLEQILNWLEPAATAGAKLVVFPECALSGYGFASREQGFDHAVSLDSAPVHTVVAACERHQCYCVFGLLERDGDRLFNACVLTGPQRSGRELSQGASAVSGHRHVRRPRRPAVRGSRRGRPEGWHAHLL